MSRDFKLTTTAEKQVSEILNYLYMNGSSISSVANIFNAGCNPDTCPKYIATNTMQNLNIKNVSYAYAMHSPYEKKAVSWEGGSGDS